MKDKIKNINIKNKVLIQVYKKNVAWDMICSNKILNESGWQKIFNYFLSLPQIDDIIKK